MNRIVALAGAGLLVAVLALSINAGPEAEAAAWLVALGSLLAAAFFGWRVWREPQARGAQAGTIAKVQSSRNAGADFPGAWRGPSVPLATQIDALKGAGLALAPGRTIDELLTSWPRAEYESDPYNLLLFMYGVEVEVQPWGRFFCERGWNFDMECLNEAGDYVRAFENILRITGQPRLATRMSDNFNPNAKVCEIRYTMGGRASVLKAKVGDDWADPEAVAAFVRDVETTIGDGRHFWAADNGQASVLFFLTDAEAARVNELRSDILMRYVRP
jgi:hypothetical protein